MAAAQDLSEGHLWSVGSPEWVPLKTHLPHFSEFLKSQIDAEDQPHWMFQYNGQCSNPMTLHELMEQIQNIPHYVKSVLIKQKDHSEWRPVTSFHELMNLLGINQRHNKRVPLTAKGAVELNGYIRPCGVKTLSIGGLGFNCEDENFFVGQKLKITIHTELLPTPIITYGHISYANGHEYGFVFEKVQAEDLSHIVDYVRKIEDPLQSAPKIKKAS